MIIIIVIDDTLNQGHLALFPVQARPMMAAIASLSSYIIPTFYRSNKP